MAVNFGRGWVCVGCPLGVGALAQNLVFFARFALRACRHPGSRPSVKSLQHTPTHARAHRFSYVDPACLDRQLAVRPEAIFVVRGGSARKSAAVGDSFENGGVWVAGGGGPLVNRVSRMWPGMSGGHKVGFGGRCRASREIPG